jgi:hypothetical protein
LVNPWAHLQQGDEHVLQSGGGRADSFDGGAPGGRPAESLGDGVPPAGPGPHVQPVAEHLRVLDVRIVAGCFAQRRKRPAEHFEDAVLQRRPQRGGRTLDRQAPGLQEADPVAASGFVHVRGADQDREVFLGDQADDQLPEGLARARIHAGGRLIQQEDPRAVDQRGRQSEFLFHPARELPGGAAGEFPQADEIQDFPAARQPAVSRKPAHFGEEAEVLEDRQFLVQRESLRQIADLRARVFDLARHLESGDDDPARRGRERAAEQAHGGGFPGAVRADQCVDLAPADAQREAVDGPEVVEHLHHVKRFDRRLVACHVRIQFPLSLPLGRGGGGKRRRPYWNFTSAGMPGFNPVSPSPTVISTAKTVVRRPSSVWTLRGVNWALSAIRVTVPENILPGNESTVISTAWPSRISP